MNNIGRRLNDHCQRWFPRTGAVPEDIRLEIQAYGPELDAMLTPAQRRRLRKKDRKASQ